MTDIPIHWQDTVKRLNELVTLQTISDYTGIPIGTLGDMKAGRAVEPRHGAGQRLLSLLRIEESKVKAKQRRQDDRDAARGKRA